MKKIIKFINKSLPNSKIRHFTIGVVVGLISILGVYFHTRDIDAGMALVFALLVGILIEFVQNIFFKAEFDLEDVMFTSLGGLTITFIFLFF